MIRYELLTNEIKQRIYNKYPHNIVYKKLNFDIPLPPPYYREISGYKKANIKGMHRVSLRFNWLYRHKLNRFMEKLKYRLKI